MTHIDIVFDGPPEAEAGRFVEVEDATGASVKFGEWVEREDGYWVLRIEASAQAPTDDEREALAMLLRSISEAGNPSWYDDADVILDAGFRRPAQGDYYEGFEEGVTVGRNTDEERETLPVAPRETWGWDTCVVCGSKEVSDRGMIILGASNGAPYAARIAWCDQSQECREDLRQTSFLYSLSFDANMIDALHHPAQTDPTDAQVLATMTDPNSITDEQADAAQLAHYQFVFGDEELPNQRELGIGRQAMKVAISEAVRAALTADQEEQS